MRAPNPSSSALTVLLVQQPPAVPSPAEVMTMTVELPPGDPGTPPHRHAGPVFGYMLEGEVTGRAQAASRAARTCAGLVPLSSSSVAAPPVTLAVSQ